MAPDHMQSRFDSGLVHLGQYLREFKDAGLRHAIEDFRSATATEPGRAAHWVALGFSLDAADRPREALAALERAAQLDPEDEEVEVFILTLRCELGPEHEALAVVEAAAARRNIDLDELRAELTGAEMPTDSRTLVQNAFIRARNFTRSSLEDEIDRTQRGADPKVWRQRDEVARRECTEEQNRLESSLNPALVPSAVRLAVTWASRLGVGDAACRSHLFGALTRTEKTQLADVLQRVAPAINAWLDSFGEVALTEEAAALMFLLLGVEESESTL